MTVVDVAARTTDARRRDAGRFTISDVAFAPDVRLPRHEHPRGCLAVVVEGSVRKAYDHATHDAARGTVIAMPAAEPHADAFGDAGFADQSHFTRSFARAARAGLRCRRRRGRWRRLETGGAHLTVHDVFGLQTLELQTFAFTARASADGSADGWFTYRELDDGAPFSAGGPVSCLTVIGRDAWIGGVISRSNDPTYNGLGAWWHVTDNHDAAGAQADITTFMGVGTLADTQAFCAGHPAYRHPFPIDGGNIEVRD